MQTVWGPVFRRYRPVCSKRERIELDDGDFIDIEWSGNNDQGPLLILLHGLGGGLNSPYIQGLMSACLPYDWQSVLIHFRGCSGEPNRLARSYHSGDTKDVETVVSYIQSCYPERLLLGVGYSLGGNVLLKWLGETGDDNPLAAAVAVSVPFELHRAATHMLRGLGPRFYQWYLLREIKLALREKVKRRGVPMPESEFKPAKTFWEFDQKLTAPLHGFDSVYDYYRESSCKQYLHGITKPTLILHAKDDPFMTPAVIPAADELSASTRLELSDNGGHVGFVAASRQGKPRYWLEERIPEYFLGELAQLADRQFIPHFAHVTIPRSDIL